MTASRPVHKSKIKVQKFYRNKVILQEKILEINKKFFRKDLTFEGKYDIINTSNEREVLKWNVCMKELALIFTKGSA